MNQVKSRFFLDIARGGGHFFSFSKFVLKNLTCEKRVELYTVTCFYKTRHFFQKKCHLAIDPTDLSRYVKNRDEVIVQNEYLKNFNIIKSLNLARKGGLLFVI